MRRNAVGFSSAPRWSCASSSDARSEQRSYLPATFTPRSVARERPASRSELPGGRLRIGGSPDKRLQKRLHRFRRDRLDQMPVTATRNALRPQGVARTCSASLQPSMSGSPMGLVCFGSAAWLRQDNEAASRGPSVHFSRRLQCLYLRWTSKPACRVAPTNLAESGRPHWQHPRRTLSESSRFAPPGSPGFCSSFSRWSPSPHACRPRLRAA